LRLTRRNAPRALLVVAEIAMAMVLLIGGGLMIHSFAKLVNADSGYESSNVLTFQVRRPASRSSTTELVSVSELLPQDLSSAPGVRAAAYAAHLPLLMLKVNMGFRTSAAERIPEPADGPAPATPFFPDIRVVSHGYFATLGIPLTAGRGFRESDGADAPRVVVVNDAFASARFPGQNPIGRLLFGPGERPWEIVGLAGDVRQQGADRPPEPQIFIEYRQWPLPGIQNPLYYVVRTEGEPRRMLPAIRSLVTRRDSEATLENTATLDELVASAMARPRLYAVVLGIFAGVAAVLAAVGIYGVVAFSVAQSTREIGIRVALGAGRREVLALVLRHGLVLAAAGSAIGVAGAVAATRLLQGMLFGLAPLDAPTYVAVLGFFAGVALLASYLPARRALRVDPLVALRHD
jgi:putative ABC transport system permease protein